MPEYFFSTIIFLWVYLFQQPQVEMADKFRGEGKIYVVIAVIVIILAGIFFTLVRMDKKLNSLEKQEEKEQ